MLKYLKEKDTDSKAWEMWIAIYPNMDKDSFISFNDFKDKLKTPKVSNRPKEDILREVEEIRRKLANKEVK